MIHIETIPKIVDLKARPGQEACRYLLEHQPALAIKAALTTRKPLLVRGEPGVGKSQLARAAADLLGRSYVVHSVNNRTETDDLLWTADLVARLTEAQLARGDADRFRTRLAHFIKPGPLWWALNWRGAQTQLEMFYKARDGNPQAAQSPDAWSREGAVVLIDEIDKADAAIPNGLLDVLGHGGFDVPEIGRITPEKGASRPLIIFTTNRERYLPDAFLRRCWVLTLSLSEEKGLLAKQLLERGRAHHRETVSDKVYQRAVEIIVHARLSPEAQGRYRPSVAELLDLIAAVKGAPNAVSLLDELKHFVVDKQGA